VIRYALNCDRQHAWKAWFDSIASFESQQERGLVECPVCASTAVQRAPMAPAVVLSRTAARELPPLASAPPVPGAAPEAAALLDGPDGLKLPPELREALDRVRAHVRDTFDYVGDSFAREARAIHEGDSEARAIYGEASPSEVRDLLDDGIAVAPLPGIVTPRPPEQLN
jgi:hypothetical protein